MATFEDAVSLSDVDAVSITSDDSQAESEFDDKSANSYLSMLSSLFWTTTYAVERKPSYIYGVDDWVPADLEKIVEFPRDLLPKYSRVYPVKSGLEPDRNGSFSVIVNSTQKEDVPLETASEKNSVQVNMNSINTDNSESIPKFSLSGSRPSSPNSDSSLDRNGSNSPRANETKPPLHHLVISFWTHPTPKSENKYSLSLFRSRDIHDVIALCEHCRECRDLFRLQPRSIPKESYLKDLLKVMRDHVLWKSPHLAAALGLVEYFPPNSRSTRSNIRLLSQPDGLTPLMIAISHNKIQLASHLIALCPDSVTAMVEPVHLNNVLHLAAGSSAEMVEMLLKNEKFKKLINSPNKSGASPLYFALTSANPFVAKVLRNHGANFSADASPTQCKPLVDAMKTNKYDISLIKSILDVYPDAINETDPLTGNTVLHSAMFKKPFLALLQVKREALDLNSRNFHMQTPLHLYVQRGDLSLVMALAAFGADLNVKDNNGNTALHLAVSNLHTEIVRVLLCLGADPNLVNNYSETPRHLGAKFKNNKAALDIVQSLAICGARCCPENFVGCTSHCMHKDNRVCTCRHSSSPSLPSCSSSKSLQSEECYCKGAGLAGFASKTDVPEDEEFSNRVKCFPQEMAIKRLLEKLKRCAERNEDSNFINVLSLDGGGIKGLVIVQILLAIEKYLNRPLTSYFDWIAGTSTGSFVAGSLSLGYSLHHMQQTYLRFKDALFDSWTRPYNAQVLESLLKEMFGENTKMSDIQYPRVFFTTVRADTFPVQLELVRNYRLPLDEKENEGLGFSNPADIHVWRAARRSSAAPTYFPASEGKFIDGGMVSNNPTLDLLSEIILWNSCCKYKNIPKDVRIGCVVSIGTGITPCSPVDPILFEMSDLFGMLRGMKNLSLMVLDQATATEGAPISRSRAWCHSLSIPYFRLNAPLFKDIVLDSNEDADLVRMMWDVVEYTYAHRKDLEDLARVLNAVGTNRNRKKQFLAE